MHAEPSRIDHQQQTGKQAGKQASKQASRQSIINSQASQCKNSPSQLVLPGAVVLLKLGHCWHVVLVASVSLLE
jgi:hypothetical protein